MQREQRLQRSRLNNARRLEEEDETVRQARLEDVGLTPKRELNEKMRQPSKGDCKC